MSMNGAAGSGWTEVVEGMLREDRALSDLLLAQLELYERAAGSGVQPPANSWTPLWQHAILVQSLLFEQLGLLPDGWLPLSDKLEELARESIEASDRAIESYLGLVDKHARLWGGPSSHPEPMLHVWRALLESYDARRFRLAALRARSAPRQRSSRADPGWLAALSAAVRSWERALRRSEVGSAEAYACLDLIKAYKFRLPEEPGPSPPSGTAARGRGRKKTKGRPRN